LNIGFDLDNTVWDLTSSFKSVFDKYGEEFFVPTSWDFGGYPEHIKKDIFNDLFVNPDKMCNLEPFPGVINKLTTWQLQGHNLLAITARSKIIESQTKKVVKALFNCDCICTDLNYSKLDVLIENKIDVWIDDHPEQVLEVIEKTNIDTYLISTNLTPYNYYVRSKCNWVENLSLVKL
jgi:phosphoglycolate phosphatase-like HAD superfamily hydrolase